MRLNYNDLKQFASDDANRIALRQPWLWCGEMWASNGRIAIRTPWDGMRFDQPEADAAPHVERANVRTCSHVWNRCWDFTSWDSKPLRQFWTWNDHTAQAILPPESFRCENCGGSGRCPYDPEGSQWECEECDGRGKLPNTSSYLLHPDCPAVQAQYLTPLATLLVGAVWETVPGHALGKDDKITVWRITHGETRAILMPLAGKLSNTPIVPLFR